MLGSSSGLRCKLDRDFFKRRTLYFTRLAPLGVLVLGCKVRDQLESAEPFRTPATEGHKNDPQALCLRMSVYLADGKLGGPVGAGNK